MIVVKIIEAAEALTVSVPKEENNEILGACIIAHRNNEMKRLIAKYFLRFLYELTVISLCNRVHYMILSFILYKLLLIIALLTLKLNVRAFGVLINVYN